MFLADRAIKLLKWLSTVICLLLTCLSVNWNANTSLNNESQVYSTREGANQPGGKQAKGRTSQRANEPGGEQARGRKSQGVNKPGGERAKGESARGRTSHGPNETGSKQARGEPSVHGQTSTCWRLQPAKGRKSHNSCHRVRVRLRVRCRFGAGDGSSSDDGGAGVVAGRKSH